MVIRKHGKKWQCLVRVKGVAVTQSFVSKSDARLWDQKTEVHIMLVNKTIEKIYKNAFIINNDDIYVFGGISSKKVFFCNVA